MAGRRDAEHRAGSQPWALLGVAPKWEELPDVMGARDVHWPEAVSPKVWWEGLGPRLSLRCCPAVAVLEGHVGQMAQPSQAWH